MRNVIALTVDNDHALDLFPWYFARHDIQTIPATDGEEAIDLLQRIAVNGDTLDVITTDITHSPPDGIELIRLIRSFPDEMTITGHLRLKHIPIVVISANNEIESITQEIGADGFLRKPFDIEELENIVTKYILH